MIKANELRIGNKLLSPFGKIETVLDLQDNTDRGKIVFVDDEHRRMYSHIITVNENRNQYKPCEISGVDLSPEILEKCGFEYEDMGDESPYERWVCKEYTELWVWNFNDKEWVFCLGDGFQQDGFHYLHQLQNLYYFLVGEELTYKP